MRIATFIGVLAVSALLMSCDRQPVSPDLEVGPLFQATHEVFSYDFIEDATWYLECANGGVGEDVHFTGPYTWVERHTTSSSGNLNMQFEVIYDPTFQGVGLTSGDVWIIDHNAFSSHRNLHGDGESYEQHINEWYQNQDGDRLHLLSNFHRTRDANGNIKVLRFAGFCPGN